MDDARVVAVALNPEHGVGKGVQDTITLVEDHGVEGDAHAGKTVQHEFLKGKNQSAPNLRPVHLIHHELYDALNRELGAQLKAGEMGENMLTHGIALPMLPVGTLLRFPSGAELELTGLRTPCKQLEALHPGLMKAVMGRDEHDKPFSQLGAMSVVRKGGEVRADDPIEVIEPAEPKAMKPV